MVIAHNLGFPRIGVHREMKKMVETYWRGETSQETLQKQALQLQTQHWKMQADQGLHLIQVGDFSWYDHVLDTSFLFGVIPERFASTAMTADMNTVFCMARGQAPNGQEAAACELTKLFNTNYHYLVPEFSEDQSFRLLSDMFLRNVDHALQQGYAIKPVLLGPLTFLWLGKCQNNGAWDRLSLLPRLLPVYQALLRQLSQRGVEWVQLDEPILVLDLPEHWRSAFKSTYHALSSSGVRCLLTTYFGGLENQLDLVETLPVAGWHIDVCRAPHQLDLVLKHLPRETMLSLGLVDGRNVWRTDLSRALSQAETAHRVLGERLWLAGSCSLLHVPVDLDEETQLDAELKSWLAFAKQKIQEIRTLTDALNFGKNAVADVLESNRAAIVTRKTSQRVHHPRVQQRMATVDITITERQSPYPQRAVVQKNPLVPLLPTTTIGSFPQTKEIRTIRRDYKQGKMSAAVYEEKMRQEITDVIQIQEDLGLDVLVHGEPERNDMVEYFGELLEGVAFTQNGWVQSYGSRCVKPPIIFGDVSRSQPMTVRWSQYAQTLTSQPVKGMLTGPVTILAWSFVRDDQPRQHTALQIALALRDEVLDLESAGIHVIQIDEPAFREILPLRRSEWPDYFDWAVRCFRVASSGVKDTTQIHTHMCYSEFNDILSAIAALDADVITIESSRSHMELLKAFEHFSYPNEIGPGVYDIHSPRVPTVAEIEALLQHALHYIPIERLWVNPDCGLKTRQWKEVKLALVNMVQAAKRLRARVVKNTEELVTAESL
ncbi:MAG: 5-methyltetrahydropteroyltriglutamate--homocysteine S-methyltransferase [Coxiella sp. RIFCSPHIGHO2_12_FULL_44_14]|nr:MAG: 5-methyltetrahydropteroyltriglutamate--homocysteine S-methyltransferase [Coxiella sp. RIFCSPHIGHO2_12_FULL_44_14]